MRNLFNALALALAVVFTACSSDLRDDYFRVEGLAQGTTYSITYRDSLKRDFSHSIDSILCAVDSSMSVYNAQSLISRINRNESTYADPMLIEMVRQSMLVSQQTGSRFDITVGPLVRAWGFGPDDRRTPDSSHIAQLRQWVGMDKIRIDGNTVIKADSNVVVDVNAIAQGYTSDVIANFFRSKGLQHYLVEVGGEIASQGLNVKGGPWVVGIDKPVENALPGENLQVKLRISGVALATSGNYRKFYLENGVKYSHTIDPLTGYPARHTLLSASVVAPTAALADAYATAMMVMGLDQAIELIGRLPQVEAYLVYSGAQGEYLVWTSPGIDSLIVP